MTPQKIPQTLIQDIGDSVDHSIALSWYGADFSPGEDWVLIFTAKRKATDPDSSAVIQKASGVGITHTGSTAVVGIVPADTNGLDPCTLVWDVQGQHTGTGEVRTVAKGGLKLTRDVTRQTQTSVPVNTTEEPAPGAFGAVRYNVAQTLTPEQKAQARENMGAIRLEDLPPVLIRSTAEGPPVNGDAGAIQVETATIVVPTVTNVDITNLFDITIIMGGVPSGLQVTLTAGMSASDVAQAIRQTMAAQTYWTSRFSIGGTGPQVSLSKLAVAANDSTLNIIIPSNTNGITAAPTSANTTAGRAAITGTPAAAVGQVCRVGSEAPYRWFVATALVLPTWEETSATSASIAAAIGGTPARLTDIPTTLPASDVYPWAKAPAKPAYTAAEISGLGDSATKNTGTTPGTVAAGDHTHPLKYYKTICCVGTSITFAGNSVTTTAGGPRESDSTGGHSGWLRHLLGGNVTYPLRSDRGETTYNHGWSGWNLSGNGTQGGIVYGANGFTPADDALKADADLYVLEGGTNDISNSYSTANVIANITAYWTKFRSAGRDVIALNVPPQGSASGATKRDAILTVNAALPAIAASLGVTLVDIHSLATFDGNGYATTDSLYDGIHPTQAYAHKIAKAIVAAIPAAKIADLNIIPKDSSAQWITTSNSPSGSSIPSGWTKSGSSFTDTYSAVTDADTTTWQRITIARSGGTAKSALGYINQTTSGFQAGDVLRVCANIRAATGTLALQDFSVAVNCYANGTNITTVVIQGGNQPCIMDPITGVFVSPPFVVPAGTTAVTAQLQFYCDNITFDVRNFGVFKVSDGVADVTSAAHTTASRAVGSALGLTTATPATLTSITLAAGEWDISAVGGFTGTPTGGTELSLGVATTTNSFTGSTIGDSKVQTILMPVSGIDVTQTIPSVKVTPTASTTYYLVAQATFPTGAVAGYGRISARRIR